MEWINYSYSQEGEDIILDNIFERKKEGFYIDIGAYHPFQYSNTMRFYERGWHGLNIDATPGCKNLFNRYRKRDINIEAGITEDNSELIYYIFKEGALNTFDENRIEQLKSFGYIPSEKKLIKTHTIMEILDKYVEAGQIIDFMDIDIEGFDEKVISQMDFGKYQPTVILIENLEGRGSVTLENNGYKIIAFTGRSAIYKK